MTNCSPKCLEDVKLALSQNPHCCPAYLSTVRQASSHASGSGPQELTYWMAITIFSSTKLQNVDAEGKLDQSRAWYQSDDIKWDNIFWVNYVKIYIEDNVCMYFNFPLLIQLFVVILHFLDII